MGQESINRTSGKPAPRAAPPAARSLFGVAMETAESVLGADGGDDGLAIAAGQLLLLHELVSEMSALRGTVGRAVDRLEHMAVRLEDLAAAAEPLLSSPAAKVARGATRLRNLVVGGG